MVCAGRLNSPRIDFFVSLRTQTYFRLSLLSAETRDSRKCFRLRGLIFRVLQLFSFSWRSPWCKKLYNLRRFLSTGWCLDFKINSKSFVKENVCSVMKSVHIIVVQEKAANQTLIVSNYNSISKRMVNLPRVSYETHHRKLQPPSY